MDSPIDLPEAAVPGVHRPIAHSAIARTLRTAAGLAVALLFLLTFLRLVNVSSVAQRLQRNERPDGQPRSPRASPCARGDCILQPAHQWQPTP